MVVLGIGMESCLGIVHGLTTLLDEVKVHLQPLQNTCTEYTQAPTRLLSHAGLFNRTWRGAPNLVQYFCGLFYEVVTISGYSYKAGACGSVVA
jgi:hypothetical protein